MQNTAKKKQLKRFKLLATGLFILMAFTFVVSTYLQKSSDAHWIGYVKAFSEAAMVGALADWFAVTALFHYPMGIKIPHTNLIQTKKNQIGDNLGNFVVENFLSPSSIRPYIKNLKISGIVSNFLSKEKNQDLLLSQMFEILKDVLLKIDDREATNFLESKAKSLIREVELENTLRNLLQHIIERDMHQPLITQLSLEIESYIELNSEFIKTRVEKQSYTLIPKFIDRAIAEKITSGLQQFFYEVAIDKSHPIRDEITTKLQEFSVKLTTEEKLQLKIHELKTDLISSPMFSTITSELWIKFKISLEKELEKEESPIYSYLKKNIAEFSSNLQNNNNWQEKIDSWARHTGYKLILRNSNQFSSLISSTIENWEGKELSRKLELEVGKDLQFIRINGTLVGGFVGLIIYTISHFFI